MTTTIQIGLDLLNKLQMMKIHKKESYEDIIWDLIEDRMELSEETKKNLKLSERDLREGKTISLEELKNKRRI
jgi:predicted CopG family antitoxin